MIICLNGKFSDGYFEIEMKRKYEERKKDDTLNSYAGKL